MFINKLYKVKFERTYKMVILVSASNEDEACENASNLADLDEIDHYLDDDNFEVEEAR